MSLLPRFAAPCSLPFTAHRSSPFTVHRSLPFAVLRFRSPFTVRPPMLIAVHCSASLSSQPLAAQSSTYSKDMFVMFFKRCLSYVHFDLLFIAHRRSPFAAHRRLPFTAHCNSPFSVFRSAITVRTSPFTAVHRSLPVAVSTYSKQMCVMCFS